MLGSIATSAPDQLPIAFSAACWRSRSRLSTTLWPGNFGNLAQQLEPAADRIDLDLLASGLAAQLAFEHALEAEFPDLVAHPIVVGVAEIALGDLADVAEQMRRERPVDVMALRHHLEADAR